MSSKFSFPVRYTHIDFAEEFLKGVFFNILFWGLRKLGRILINWSKPYLREFMAFLRLVFHYFAWRLNIESTLKFMIVYFAYLLRRPCFLTHIFNQFLECAVG